MKQKLLLLAIAFTSLNLYAVIEVGESVPEKCWTTVDNKETCLSDSKNVVQVLVYNAGWCGPCNEEFEELAPASVEFDGKPVRFISLSSEGWRHGSTPDATFLSEWRDKHEIPFTVAASPKDAGKMFFEKIFIPNVAVIDQKGNLAYKAVNPGVKKLFEEIHKLID